MILMNDFTQDPIALRAAMLTAVRRVMESGWYILGDEVVTFERLWAETCGSSNSVGVGNGMDAIEIALRSLGIGPGDEVITTAMTAFATILAIIRAGATPVLADISQETALLSIDSVERCITKYTKAIVLVHLYGQVRGMDAWVSLCADRSIHLIEDCAQSHLASWRGKMAGTFGVAGAFSFYPTKNLGGLGDGGMLITDDQLLAIAARKLRNYGQDIRYHHSEIGLNSRLDELQAALLIERLKWLPQFTARRRQIASVYRLEINNPHITNLAEPEEDQAHVNHLYVLRCSARFELQQHLQNDEIQSSCHYPVPMHHQKPCQSIKRDVLGLPNSERHAATCLSLPCHPYMTDTDIDRVISSVNLFKPSNN